MWRNRSPCTLLVGIQTGAANVVNNVKGPQKIKHRTAYELAIPLLEIYPKKPELLIRKNICTPMFIAVLFIVAKM